MAETIVGGYYIGEDGQPHDAEGRVLDDPNAVQVQVDVVDAVDGEAEPAAPAPAVAGKKRGK